MKTFKYTFPEKSVNITAISDTHVGDKLFNKAALIPYLEEADYLILNGDIMNTATKQSVSFAYGSNPQADLDEAVAIFKPYAHKIIAINEGNHEHRVAKEVGLSLTQLFAHQLGLLDKYAGTASYIFMNIGPNKILYRLYATHGFGGGRTTGAKANKLEGLSDGIDADIYVVSHTHQPMVFYQDYMRSNARTYKLDQVTKVYVNTGAFLDYGGYAERFNFKPSTIITPTVELFGTKHHIAVRGGI